MTKFRAIWSFGSISGVFFLLGCGASDVGSEKTNAEQAQINAEHQYCQQFASHECERDHGDRCTAVEKQVFLPVGGCIRRSRLFSACSAIVDCNEDVQFGRVRNGGAGSEWDYALVSGCIYTTVWKPVDEVDLPADILQWSTRVCEDIYAFTDEACRARPAEVCPTELQLNVCGVAQGHLYDEQRDCVDYDIGTAPECREFGIGVPQHRLLKDTDGRYWYFASTVAAPKGLIDEGVYQLRSGERFSFAPCN